MTILKHKSLRVKILLVFSVVFLVLLILLMSIMSFFVRDYYISTNQHHMQEAVNQMIQEMKPQESLLMEERLIRLQGLIGGTAQVFSPSGQLLGVQQLGIGEAGMTSLEAIEIRDWMNEAERNEFLGVFENERYGTSQRYEASQPEEMLQNNEMLQSNLLNVGEGRIVYAKLMGKNMVVVTKPLGLVDEATTIFFAFMIRASIGVYLVGVILLFVVTSYMTKPLKRMQKITGQMAELDFTESLQVRTEDEIGALMSSINQMADKLSTAIESLNISNVKLSKELNKEKSLEKMRRRFVSDVSHELKNPLAMILAYVEGLQQNIPKTDEAKTEYYEIINDEAKRMNHLIHNLLDLSALTSGTYVCQRDTFMVEPLIKETVLRFEHLHHQKEIQVNYSIEPGIQWTGDSLKIQQVLVNLLSNAFKHVNEKGTIHIKLEQDKKVNRLVIENTGDLIPEGELDLIWNSFYQVNTNTRGSGLGLAIVKSIVELHQGTCRAYIQNDRNCFEISI